MNFMTVSFTTAVLAFTLAANVSHADILPGDEAAAEFEKKIIELYGDQEAPAPFDFMGYKECIDRANEIGTIEAVNFCNTNF